MERVLPARTPEGPLALAGFSFGAFVTSQALAAAYASRDDVRPLGFRVGYEKLHAETGWTPRVSWEEGIRRTIAWYAANRDWWEPLRDRAPVIEDSWATAGK